MNMLKNGKSSCFLKEITSKPKHGTNFTTKLLHLSGFLDIIGKLVKSGQVSTAHRKPTTNRIVIRRKKTY